MIPEDEVVHEVVMYVLETCVVMFIQAGVS